MTATGILVFFEIETGLMAVVHQWFSWFFAGGVLVKSSGFPVKDSFRAAD